MIDVIVIVYAYFLIYNNYVILQVITNCWNTTEEIVRWMESNGHNLTEDSYYERWREYHDKAFQIFTDVNEGKTVPGIIWTSKITKDRRAAKLDRTKYIIQIWSDSNATLIKEVVEGGFRVIFSNYDALYLDCGFGAFIGDGNNWCSPYKEWQKIYDNSPTEIVSRLTGIDAKNNKLILGGEAPLWAEQVDDTNVESKVSMYSSLR